MAEPLGRSPVHHIVAALGGALQRLGATVSPPEVERRAFTVHRAISARGREFHTHEHVLEMAEEQDPIGTLAALYHDLVYVQVDQGLPESTSALLEPLLRREEGGYRVLPAVEATPATKDVLVVFGHSVGELLNPFTGLNELASALVAAQELTALLTREQSLSLAACIEATIPFRDSLGPALATRLEGLGLAKDVAHRLVTLAVRIANEDVSNFADEDSAHFLDNTWKLLPETNPALHAPKTYTVVEYRTALMRMEGFLSTLSAARVFHQWGGEPSPEVHARRVAAAVRNIALADRYLMQKLYSIAFVEALCVDTGGDMPLDYFMGGIPTPGERLLRVEQFLDASDSTVVGDPVLQELLDGGRATASRFDTSPSPLAAYLHRALGELRTTQGVAQAKAWWAGKSSARAFLEAQPAPVVAAIARAASNIVDTRKASLLRIAERLGG